MSKRLCYLHVGMPKTGTKALQAFFARNEAALAELGLLVPRTGRGSWDGHHNVAFELCGDAQFTAADGTFEELTAELAGSGLPRACVSAEDLSRLSNRPDVLAGVRDALRLAGYETKIVIYLRDRSDFIESLYPTLVFQGYREPFAAYLSDALERRPRVPGSWQFLVAEYAQVLDGFSAVLGSENVIVRRYESTGDPAWLPTDVFENAFGLVLPPQLRAAATFEHVRFTMTETLLRLCANRGWEDGAARRTVLEGERARNDRERPVAFRPLDARALQHIRERFDAPNADLETRWGVRIASVSPVTRVGDVARRDVDRSATLAALDAIASAERERVALAQ
jgi:hypothetical protein